MAVHSFKTEQCIPASIEETWNFFSDPGNLPLITPETLSFRVTSRFHGARMYPGQIIEYTVAPLAGISVYWMTEITHVQEHKFFVDEQRIGPYAMWHHQHFFESVEGGVQMTDIVHYKNPFGPVGDIFNSWLVKPRLKNIFEFRKARIAEIFGMI